MWNTSFSRAFCHSVLEKGILGHSCYEGGDGESGRPALTGKQEQGNTEVKGMENEWTAQECLKRLQGVTLCFLKTTYTHTFTQTHSYTHPYVHTHIHSHTHTYTCVYIHTYIHIHTHKHEHTYVSMHTWTYFAYVIGNDNVPPNNNILFNKTPRNRHEKLPFEFLVIVFSLRSS